MFFCLVVGTFSALRVTSLSSIVFYSSLLHGAVLILVLLSGRFTCTGWVAVVFYIVFYTITVVSLYIAIDAALGRWFLNKDFTGSKIFFVSTVFSLASLPPFVGFFAKLLAVFVATQNVMHYVSSFVLLSGFIAVIYYGRLIGTLFLAKLLGPTLIQTLKSFHTTLLVAGRNSKNYYRAAYVLLLNLVFVVSSLPPLY